MKSDRLYVGVDPGTEGALTVLDDECVHDIVFFKTVTESDIVEYLHDLRRACNGRFFGVLEEVHSMPGQGVCSTFKFGKAYGFIRGVLLTVGVPFDDATPQKWQRELKCLTGGDKNISKAKAQQLFPGVKVTNKTADSVCIAEYAKRLYHQRNGV